MSLQPLHRGGAWSRVRTWLGRRGAEHNVRDSIAELVQQSADEVPKEGAIPELDRQERALLANALEAVRAEEIALRLDQVRGAAALAVAVEIGKRRG